MATISSVASAETITSHAFFKDVSTWTQHEILEGTTIRVFWNGKEWCKATSKCVNAYNSSWENVASFGKLFDSVVENILQYNDLDKENTYFFVIQHPINRLVIPINESKVYLAGIIHTNTGISNAAGYPSGIDWLPKFTFKSFEEMLSFINSQPWTFRGIVLENERHELLQIENEQYTTIRELKGNMSSIGLNWKVKEGVSPSVFRLLQIIRENRQEEFLQYFPEYHEQINIIMNNITNLTADIYNTYVAKFIYKQQVPEELVNRYNNFLKKLHYTYCLTRQNMNMDTALAVVRECPLYQLMEHLQYIDNTSSPVITN
jgi:hypothetical protein